MKKDAKAKSETKSKGVKRLDSKTFLIDGYKVSQDQIIVYWSGKKYSQQTLSKTFGKLEYTGQHPFRKNTKMIYVRSIDMTFVVNYQTDIITTVITGKH